MIDFKKAKANIIEMRKLGKKHSEICDWLKEHTYKNSNGKEVTPQILSKQLIEWGYRSHAPKNRIKTKTKIGTNQVFLKDVEDIVTSSLNPKLKERLLKAMLNETST